MSTPRYRGTTNARPTTTGSSPAGTGSTPAALQRAAPVPASINVSVCALAITPPSTGHSCIGSLPGSGVAHRRAPDRASSAATPRAALYTSATSTLSPLPTSAPGGSDGAVHRGSPAATSKACSTDGPPPAGTT